MFAPLKRIMILAVALMLPGVAFSYVSIEKIEVDNLVPAGSEGFVVSITATVSAGDTWESSEFDFDNYEPICLDNDDFGPGTHTKIFYVPFADGEVAGDEGDDDFDFYTYDDDDCDDSNNWNLVNKDVNIDGFEWDSVTGFAVQKAFRPASDMEVQVDINCSAGSPGDDSAMIGDGEIQIFPQEFLNPSNPNHNCVITEADVPAGYEVLYITNPDEGDGLWSYDGCFFYGSGNMRSTNTCQIANLGLPGTFTVTKNWEVFQEDDTNFVDTEELRVRLTASCNRDIMSGHIADEGICLDDDNDSSYNGCDFGPISAPTGVSWVVTGDATMTLTVDNQGYEPVVCFAGEDIIYSNTEQTFSNCRNDSGRIDFAIAPGGSAGCGFINTVFFEGIPTLSQYGMALMALLMLGVGFVGFRRFV